MRYMETLDSRGSGKNVFSFTIHCEPTFAYSPSSRSKKLSWQCQCAITPIDWPFFLLKPLAAQCLRGRGGKTLQILGKQHNFSWTPCITGSRYSVKGTWTWSSWSENGSHRKISRKLQKTNTSASTAPFSAAPSK